MNETESSEIIVRKFIGMETKLLGLLVSRQFEPGL
jgi:hypothetical protein